MIALDTNVVVRFLVDDEPAQALRARRLIEGALLRGEPLFLSLIVLCELEWVLTGSYGVRRAELVATLRKLVGADGFVVEGGAAVVSALERFGRGRADLSDYLIGSVAHAAGAATVFTFDRTLRAEAGFTQA